MKYIRTILSFFVSLQICSQGVWERPDTEKPVTEKKVKKEIEKGDNKIDDK